MKIRLMGTRDEIEAVVPVLDTVLNVVEISDFYPNRGASQLGRVYLEIHGTRPDAPIRANATRLDRSGLDQSRRGVIEPGTDRRRLR